ncbi:hypothetical protein [Thalassovita aquimarina]|uniref:hypothetical protein n=1 Tax=Thalassovita aquimarina TaxID=2785917 RepID=UPI001BAFAAF6|nr:hypothetical protein [Thalassovita aquimarina]
MARDIEAVPRRPRQLHVVALSVDPHNLAYIRLSGQRVYLWFFQILAVDRGREFQSLRFPAQVLQCGNLQALHEGGSGRVYETTENLLRGNFGGKNHQI